MGLHTTILGRVAISPPLPSADVERIRAFSALYDDGEVDAVGAPPGCSPWVVCDDGCCLHWDGIEKPYDLVAWLRFVIESAGHQHRLDGVLVGERHELSTTAES